jgi:hypothetical protein
MSGAPWVHRLYGLLARFPEQGAGQDITTLSIGEPWGVYRFLDRLSVEAQHGPKP